MRVIYKPYMMKRIHKVWMDARREDMEIEKIKLNLTEFEQLKYEVESTQPWLTRDWYTNNRTVPSFIEMYGIKVERE